MIKIKRLNLDTSWQIEWNGTSLLLDPWLVGSETDYFSAFNKQWHATPPATIESLEKYDAILISQHFSDHCHEETLKLLDTSNILTTKLGAKRAGKIIPSENTAVIPPLSSGNWLKMKGLEIALLPAPKKLSASFNGIVIRSNNEAIVYCPHGYDLTKVQLDIIQQLQTTLLITSFSTFKLPFFFGGFVNPGLKHAKQLISQTNPKFIVATHDENKHSKGIVKKIAKVLYPKPEELLAAFEKQFIHLNDVHSSFEIKTETT